MALSHKSSKFLDSSLSVVIYAVQYIDPLLCYTKSLLSATIVHSVTSAAIAPMAARVGRNNTPTTPNVSGISIRVLPSLFLIVT